MPPDTSQFSVPLWSHTGRCACAGAHIASPNSAAAPSFTRSLIHISPARWRDPKCKLRLNRGGEFRRLFQIPTEALDPPAGFFEVFGLGRVGNPKRRTHSERRALHHRDALGIEQLGDEVLVGAKLLAALRRLAHRAGAGRIDIERALRPW